MFGAVGIAQPDDGNGRLFLRQDVVEIDRHQIRVRFRRRRAVVVVGIRRDAVIQKLRRRLRRRIAVVVGEFQFAIAIGVGRGFRQRDVRGLQFFGERQRECSFLVDDVAAVLDVLHEGGAGFADCGGDEAGFLRGLHERLHEQQMIVEVRVELFEDAVVFGEYRIVHVDHVAAGRTRRCAGTPQRIAVETGFSGKRSGREGGGVHHRKSRIAGMVVAEEGAVVLELGQIRRVGFGDRIRTHAVPHEQDHALGVARRGVVDFCAGFCAHAASRTQAKAAAQDLGRYMQ